MCLLLKTLLVKMFKISAITISWSLRFVFFISEQLNIGHVKSLSIDCGAHMSDNAKNRQPHSSAFITL